MTQHAYAIADQNGLAFLADVNAALAAIVTNNSGTTEPTATFPHMWWADTTAGVLKRRNAADSGWISVMSLALAISAFLEGFLAAADPAAARNVIGAAQETGGQLGGFRNLIINGNFAINQRAYVSGVATTIANQYTLDRWRVVTSGQNITFSASGNGNQVTAPAGGMEQVIEGANFGGGTYTLGWIGTATAEVNGVACLNGGSVTLPANTNAMIRFIGGTVSKAQLDPGTATTPFEHRPYGAELALCQRYYESSIFSGGRSIWSGNTTNGSGITFTITFVATKRIAPTITTVDILSPSFPAGSPSISQIGTTSFEATKIANVTGAGYFIFSWTASAEL